MGKIMRCKGIYKHNRQEQFCGKAWSCKWYAFRDKPKRETPTSKTDDCEFYIEVIGTT